jgi:hypothetical protein
MPTRLVHLCLRRCANGVRSCALLAPMIDPDRIRLRNLATGPRSGWSRNWRREGSKSIGCGSTACWAGTQRDRGALATGELGLHKGYWAVPALEGVQSSVTSRERPRAFRKVCHVGCTWILCGASTGGRGQCGTARCSRCRGWARSRMSAARLGSRSASRQQSGDEDHKSDHYVVLL